MAGGYLGDCVVHACCVAELLRSEGRSPWIGRLRHRTAHAKGTLIHPLIPARYRGAAPPVWTTHYVAASGAEVFDPLLASPIDVSSYAVEVFGQPLAVEVYLDAERTERLLASGELRRSFTPKTEEALFRAPL